MKPHLTETMLAKMLSMFPVPKYSLVGDVIKMRDELTVRVQCLVLFLTAGMLRYQRTLVPMELDF